MVTVPLAFELGLKRQPDDRRDASVTSGGELEDLVALLAVDERAKVNSLRAVLL